MRLHQVIKAKLHHARITYANPDYVGSIEICGELMRRAGIIEGEMVHIWAVDHKARIETYAFEGPRGSIGLNGGAAHHFSAGDRIIIAAFTWTDEEVSPKMFLLGENNEVVREMMPYSIYG